ncbi:MULTISPECIES: SCO3374 family protein [unclassified Streptomyces]|uniref:SCO3374 family protein n=1 Tax=unclassified Streptomyces TaxID=2593676 RepID=UPI0004BEBF9F|nr:MULTISPECIES: SCO3374 family protein [unclassified Streptomyces]
MAPNAVPAPLPLPLPRRPLAVEGTTAGAEGAGASADDAVRRWYGEGLGWATVPGTPVRLITGLRFDVLDVPRGAGAAGLRHLRPGAPVALHGDRMRLLVAAGSAEELPGLLEWLEWGSLPLDLRALGAGDGITAPAPASAPACARAAAPAVAGSQGAAVWLRPPVPGREVESSLPALSALGGGGGAPDLVRLVETVATECHRIRLRRVAAQPLAFS